MGGSIDDRLKKVYQSLPNLIVSNNFTDQQEKLNEIITDIHKIRKAELNNLKYIECKSQLYGLGFIVPIILVAGLFIYGLGKEIGEINQGQ